MKKAKILFSLLMFAPLISLFSCGNDDVSPNNQATIKIEEVEHATVTCSIPSLVGKVNQKGTLTINPEKDYYIKSVVQNDMFTLYKSSNNVFDFTLKAGENVFTISLNYVPTIESNSDLICQGNEVVVPGGTLTDDVDDLPSLGSGTSLLPEYDNPITIYFKDSSWWNTSAASTNVIVYDEADNIVSYNKNLGDMMIHLNYNGEGLFNYWKAILDGDKASKIQFVRTGDNGFTDWGARTDILPLPTEPNDMYILDDTPLWYGDGDYAKASLGKYNPSGDPKPTDHGIYTLYFETTSWWNEISSESPKCYMWGANGDKATWPGEDMEKVSENLYKIAFDTSLYKQCIFNTLNGSFQTSDLIVPLNYGENVSLIAKLPETAQSSKNFSVTWSEYKA